jgi:SAM-dependent methyltransferase
VLFDVGCGSGQLAQQLIIEIQPRQLIALDINMELIKECRARCGAFVDAVCQDICNGLNFRSSFVDGLICSNVVMHLPDNEVLDLFREISRVLKPLGSAIIVFTHPQWAADQYQTISGTNLPFSLERTWGHCRFAQYFRSESDYLELAQVAGLDLVNRAQVQIAELEGLDQRYRDKIGKPLYTLLELRKKR